MNSLSQLNTYSDTALTFTDLRTAKVTFDRVTPTAQTASYTVGGTFTVPVGINILDIVLPATEQVYFQVNVSNAAGATVTFPTLPSGYSVTTIGSGVYRVSNIQSAADWNLIKNALVQTASGYKTAFSATATIGYETSLTKSWTIAAQSTVRARLTCSATLIGNGGYLFGITGTATATSRFTMTASLNYIRKASATLISTSSITAKAVDTILKSKFDLGAIPTKIPGYMADVTGRNFTANQANAIFATNPPRITDDSNPAYYTLSLTSPKGRFSDSATSVTGSENNAYTYTGTLEQVNAWVASLYFWPTKAWTSNTTIIFVLKAVTTTIFTKTITMTYAGSASFNTYTFNSDAYWTPTYQELTYGTADILLVGAGGNGIYDTSFMGSGGGGGGVREVFGATYTNQSYYITVGQNLSGVANGTSSSALGYTATGGLGATAGTTYGNVNRGGSSGTPANGASAYTGGLGSSTAPYYGGGGAGAGANGGTFSSISGDSTKYGGNGGAGKLSTITGQYYGGGGGGAPSDPDYVPTRAGIGGIGGGGYGAAYGGHSAGNATANTGGGGGGSTGGTVGRGADGVVVIKIR